MGWYNSYGTPYSISRRASRSANGTTLLAPARSSPPSVAPRVAASVPFPHRPQPRRRALRRDIPLWHPQHLKADHKLTDSRRAQQRRIEMRVEVPLRMRLAVGGSLMEAHRVREGNPE